MLLKSIRTLFILIFLFLAQCSWVDDVFNKSDGDEPIQTHGASLCEDRTASRGEVIKNQISDEQLNQVLAEFNQINGDSDKITFKWIGKQHIKDPEVFGVIQELAKDAHSQSQKIAAKDEVLVKRLDQGYYEDLYMNLFSNMAKSDKNHTCFFLNYIYQYSYRNNLKNEDREFKTQLELTTYSATTGGQIVCEILDEAVEELQKFIFCNDEREVPSTGGGNWDDDD